MAQITGIFRIGRDAELRYTQGGKAVASLSLAFNYGQKQDNGYKPSQWIEASLWDKRAEGMAPHLLKGLMIYAVISDPHIEAYQKKDGSEGTKLVGRISEIEFAGEAKGGKESGQTEHGRAKADGYAPAPRQTAPQQSGRFDDLGDDIPFN